MDRHTESFICLSLFVILLQNTARSASEECTHSYSEAPGNISELLHTNRPTFMCRYHVKAPVQHYIRLSVTGLVGVPQASECYPKLVIKNIGEHGGQTKLDIICSNQGRTLPLVVQSFDNEIRIVFRSQKWQNSSFNATFTFHRKTGECLECATKQQQNSHIVAEAGSSSTNGRRSVMSTAGSINISVVHHQTEPPKPEPPTRPTRPMELFVLIILAPVTLVCICCVIMYYRRRTAQPTQQNPRLPSDTSPPVSTASHAPLLSSPHNSRNFPTSIDHQQALQRQQRETICRRSESTEKFPSSVTFLDEDESSSMRNVVLNSDLCREFGGIRAPPNRTVYDSEIYENRMSERSRQHQSPRVSPQSSVPRIHPLLRTESSQTGTSRDLLVDSVTSRPLQFGDSDSEGPPPYITVPTSNQPSNIGNVCEPQLFVSNSAAATGNQSRQHGRGAHPTHANGRHPPVHFELDTDQERRNRVDTVNRRSDHETTTRDVL